MYEEEKEILTETVDVKLGDGSVLEVKVPIPTNQQEVDDLRSWFKENHNVEMESVMGDYFTETGDFQVPGNDEYFTEAKELSSGIFWVITENSNLKPHKLLMFELPCESDGTLIGTPAIQPNAKSGNTYNHKNLWTNEIKNNSTHRPYNKHEYDHYPRGRVEISNNRAIIYLNPHLDTPWIIMEIKLRFGLNRHNITEVRVHPDHSSHYQCFLDRE